MSRFEIRQSFLLFLTSFFWGTNFVAQSVAMDYTGPFAFIAARSIIGGCFLLPVIAFLNYKRRQKEALGAFVQTSSSKQELPKFKANSLKIALLGGTLCGVLLFAVSTLQQYALLYTTVGKAGFLTSLYIVIVPLLSLCFGHRGNFRLWLGVGLAVVGLYLLSIHGDFSLNPGDSMMLLCALVDSVHILVIDRFAVKTCPVKMSCVQFFGCAFLATVASIIFESNQISGISNAIWQVLYAGLLSSGIAYTLQMVGQRGLNPTYAALIMSLEAVIAAVSGWAVLDETFTLRELLGCVLMFMAIIVVQVPLSFIKEQWGLHVKPTQKS